MSRFRTHLQTLTLPKLRKLAIQIGSPFSGTKTQLIANIEHDLSSKIGCQPHVSRGAKLNKASKANNDGRISLVSIDMGIRNLAYAHFTIDSKTDPDHGSPTPVLQTWKRMAVADLSPTLSHLSDLELSKNTPEQNSGDVEIESSTGEATNATKSPKTKISTESSPTKETFHPAHYAAQAYTLITSIITHHQPTHILIERQRFRSGGNTAVLEWTIRVGVFEGMLWALLHTLNRQRNLSLTSKNGECNPNIEVEGITPVKINRFWFNDVEDIAGDIDRTENDRHNSENDKTEDTAIENPKKKKSKKPKTLLNKKPTGKEMKKTKIDLVGRILDSSTPNQLPPSFSSHQGSSQDGMIPIKIAEEAQSITSDFLSRWKKSSYKGSDSRKSGTDKNKAKTKLSTDVTKLDDLADSFLQGLAWIQWKRNRDEIREQGLGKFIGEDGKK